MIHDRREMRYPPSYFHDQARKIALDYPGHEKIKQELLTYLRSKVITGLRPGAFVDRLVEGEYTILDDQKRICGYADAIEILNIDLIRTITIFEVKPKIDTVFGIVQQMKAYLCLAEQYMPAHHYAGNLVVPASDPRLAELRHQWPRTWAWGIKFDTDQDDC